MSVKYPPLTRQGGGIRIGSAPRASGSSNAPPLFFDHHGLMAGGVKRVDTPEPGPRPGLAVARPAIASSRAGGPRDSVSG